MLQGKRSIGLADLRAELRQDPAFRAAEERLRPHVILARNLLLLRARLNLTQEQVAAAAGMSQPRIAELEGARGNPGLRTLQRLAVALGTTVDRLLAPPQAATSVDERLRIDFQDAWPIQVAILHVEGRAGRRMTVSELEDLTVWKP